MPKSDGDHVQLGAVLRTVYGRLRTDADIADATAWALYHWRRRAVCWAREVRRHWLTIDAAFFPPPPTAKRRVRVVDTDHGTSKSSSFTQSVKDVETGVKSPYDLIRQYHVVIPRPRRRLVVSAAARTLRHPRPPIGRSSAGRRSRSCASPSTMSRCDRPSATTTWATRCSQGLLMVGRRRAARPGL